MSNGKACCSENFQSCPAIRKKNSDSLKKAYERGDKNAKHLDGHRGWKKGKLTVDKEKYFCRDSNKPTGKVRNILIRHNLVDYECAECRRDTWQGEDLSLELHHINGDNQDHRLENLEFLCPNCHSLTDNWRGKQNTGKKKVSDEEILKTVPKSKFIRQVCLKVGLSGRGGSHPRVRRLIEENEVELDIKKKQVNKCVDCNKEISKCAERCMECEYENRRNEKKVKCNSTNKCLDCNTKISWGASRCKSCEMKRRGETKIDWPKTEWIEKMVEKYSYSALSRRLGVSDNGIRKRIKNH